MATNRCWPIISILSKKIRNKRNKWFATAGIAVVFLFMLASGENGKSEKEVEKNTVSNSQLVQVQEQIKTNTPEEVKQNESVDVAQNEIQGEKIKVVSVVDGDTIKLENGKVVRYIGIDTPETVHPSKPVQCFGKEASAKNRELVVGKEIILVKDVSEIDKYGRLLRYVYVGDTFINDYLVRNGYANSYSYPPDIKYQEQFKQAENEARSNKRGLWADNACKAESAPVAPIAPSVNTSKPISNSGSYTCNCSKTCAQMNCAEAQYQLNSCGCTARDRDGDSVACDSDCQ